MNREIKFRTWDGEEMHYLKNSGLQYFDFEGNYSLGFTVDGYSGFWAHEQYQDQSTKSKKFPIMQFAELTDINGADIYEGDIVIAKRLMPDGGIKLFHPDPLKVVFEIGAFWMKDRHGDTTLLCEFCLPPLDEYDMQKGHLFALNRQTSLEVVGNIYNNPELM